MENTTPGPLKNNLTSTPCMKRKSLFTAPDVSPIRNGSNPKRNSATNIVSKIPVKLAKRNLLNKIPRLSGQMKTSEPEKPVLKTIENNDQSDATAKNKGKKENNLPKVTAPNKKASPSKSASSSASNKKNVDDNVSNMEWQDLDDDDGDFESTKKGKKNPSIIKKCPSPKKGKQADSKGADKKPAKSARGKKKADAEEAEVVLDNIPEETKINSKMQLDGEDANKVVETRRVVKKASNKDQKKPPARNKRKAADSDLEPVVEETNDAEDENMFHVPARNERKTAGGDLEPVAEEPMDVEDKPKSPVRNKRRTIDLGTVAEEPENVEDRKDSPARNKRRTFDLEPVAEGAKNVEDQKKTPTRNKRNSADFGQEKAEEPVEVEGQKKRATRSSKKLSDLSASVPDPIAEIKEEPSQTRKFTRTKKMKADQEEKDRASELSVEVPKEQNNEALNVDEKALEDCEPEPAPKKKKKKKNKEDIKEVSAAFSEVGDKENENVDVKEPEPEAKTETVTKTKLRKQKAALDEIPSNSQASTSAEATEAVVETKRSRRKVAVAEQEPVPVTEPNETATKTAKGSEAVVETKRSRRKVAGAEQEPVPVTEPNETATKTAKGSEDKCDQQNSSKMQTTALFCKPSTSNSRLNERADRLPSSSSSTTAKMKDVKFDSFNVTGGMRQFPLARIFGNALTTVESTIPVKVFRSIKPSENVMGGFISILPSSSHSGHSTNYNLYFLISDTPLKVNIMGVERKIENQTSFLVPKDCRFSIENLGSEPAILTFTKFRSI